LASRGSWRDCLIKYRHLTIEQLLANLPEAHRSRLVTLLDSLLAASRSPVLQEVFIDDRDRG